MSDIWKISTGVDIQYIANVVSKKIEEISKNAVFSCKDYGYHNKVLSKWIWFKDNIIDNIQASMEQTNLNNKERNF